MDYIQVTTTVDTPEAAKLLQTAILENRLGACVQILGPIESCYWWKMMIETSLEWQLIIKTKASLYDTLELFLLKIHPYTTPQIIATPIINGNAEYLAWIDAELTQED